MQTRLLLSTAVATLSLCLSPVNAQNAPREKSGPEPRQSESTAHPTRPNEKQGATTGHQRPDERAERNNNHKETHDALRLGEPTAKSTEQTERHSGAKKGEKHGAADERRAPGEQGAQTAPGTGPQNPDIARQGAGEAQPGAEGRSAPERRGENETGPEQRNRGAFDRTQPGGREASGERDNRDQRFRVGAREQGRIRQIIEQRGGQRLSPGAFDLRVGVVAPPTVAFAPLPPDVIAIAPQFQGYNYAMVGEDIAIIDPSSREVVSVLNEGGPPAAYGYNEREEFRGGYGEGWRRYGAGRDEEGPRGDYRRERRGEVYGYAPRVRLDTRQERTLYRGLIGEARENLRQVCVRVGERVPESVDIEPVPRAIAAETPDVERFDYFVLNDQVVLVDPDSRVVADIIPAPR